MPGKSKIKNQKHLYWLQSYILDLKGKRFNLTIYVCTEMQFITYYAKFGWDTWTCPHKFHVEQKMKYRETGISAVLFVCFFFSLAKNYLGKFLSPIEISRIPSKYLHASLLFIVSHYMLHYQTVYAGSMRTEWCQSIVHSACPQSTQKIYYYLAMKREIS